MGIKRSLIVLLFVVMILPPYVMAQNITPKQTTTNVNAYGEFLNIWIGKNRSIAMQLMATGGKIVLPFDVNRPEFNGLLLMRLGIGVDFKWWLYFHRSIWGDIPPGVSLFLIYQGGTESENIQKALNLSNYISSLIGVELQPFWHVQEGDRTIVLFLATVNATMAGNIMNDMILNRFPSEGLGAIASSSPVFQRNIQNEIYTRAFIEVIRDSYDIDNDSDTYEFVPILGVATIIPNVIEDFDGWYKLSLKSALELPDSYVFAPAPYANVSIVKVTFFIPVEINETYTTLPDNPGYEYSGVLLYLLKAGEKQERSEEDIVIVGKPFNATEELQKTPMIITAWLLTNIESTTLLGEPATKLIFTIVIANFGMGEAKNVSVILPLYKHHMDMFMHMLHESGLNITLVDLLEGNWTYTNVILGGHEYPAFVYELPNISGNTTITITLNITLPIDPIQFTFTRSFLLYFIHGPLVLYRDYENKPGFAMANGFLLYLGKQAKLFTWPMLLLKDVRVSPEGDFRANATVYIFNHEVSTLAIDHVDITIARGYFTGSVEGKEIKALGTAEIEEDIYPGNISDVVIPIEDKLRPGFWTITATAKYTVDIDDREAQFVLLTESIGVFIGVPFKAIERWRRRQGLPIPHVELELNKTAVVINNTLYINITIKNIGDVNTTIQVIEWLRSDIVDTVTVTVNGTKIGATVTEDTLLHVVIIRTSDIRLDVNTTVVVTIEIKLKVNVSGNITVNPTLIKYKFGPYAPPREDRPEDAYEECKKETEENETEEEIGSIRIAQFIIAQTSSEESAYSNPVTSVATITPPTGGGTGEESIGPTPGDIGKVLAIIIPIIAGIIVIVVIAKKHKS